MRQGEFDIREPLLDAWARVKGMLLADPAELKRRLDRRGRWAVGRPPRAWCLAVRACDARLDGACVDDPREGGSRRDPGRPREHRVLLDRALLLEHCARIELDPGGEVWDDVALKLGVGHAGLNWGRINGTFRTDYVRGLMGRRRHVPILYCDRALDPGAGGFSLPDRFWSWTTHFMPTLVRDGFEQMLTRVPVYRPTVSERRWKHDAVSEAGEPPLAEQGGYQRLPPPPPDPVWYKWRGDEYIGQGPEIEAKLQRDREKARERKRRWYARCRARSAGSVRFFGWRWRCPLCRRGMKMLYLPLPVAELDFTAEELGMLDEKSRASVASSRVRYRSLFACAKCHGLQFVVRREPGQAWNQLISHLSGGLLYGREVPRPAEFEPQAHCRPHVPRINRAPSRRREQITQMILDGKTRVQIAAELGIAPTTVAKHVSRILKEHGVAGRRGKAGQSLGALAKKLGAEIPTCRTYERKAA